MFVSARQHVLISYNSPVRKNYFDSNIIQNENAGILQCLQMNYFEAYIARSQCLHLTSSKREMCTSGVSNMNYHKFSYGAAFYMLNGKNVNVMLEFLFNIVLLIHKVTTWMDDFLVLWGSEFDTRSGNILSFLLPLFQEGQLSVNTGESMRTKYWLTA